MEDDIEASLTRQGIDLSKYKLVAIKEDEQSND